MINFYLPLLDKKLIFLISCIFFIYITSIMLLIIILLLQSFAPSVSAQQPLPNNTIILVPGVGGSMIFTTDKSTNETSRSWIRVFWQNDEVQKILVPYNKTTGKFDDTKYEVVIDESVAGLYSIYNLDPDLKIFTGLAEYLKHYIDYLINKGYIPGVNLFGLPYDWRYSTNRSIILDKLHNILTTHKNNIIISHSMGGIIVENYIRNYGSRTIDKWIPIAAPFKGVGGKIFQAFTSGYNLGNPLLKLFYAKQLTYLAVSTYELFPQSYLTPYPQFGFQYQTNNTLQWVDPMVFFQKLNPIFDPTRYMERKCFNTNVDTYYLSTSLLATPHTTIYDTYYDDVTFDFVPGDETVPIESSLNAQCHGQPINHDVDLLIDSSHFDLIKNTKTIDLIDRIIGTTCSVSGTYLNNDTIYIHDATTFYHKDGTIRSNQRKNFIVWRDCMHITDVVNKRIYEKISNEFKITSTKDESIVDFDLEEYGMDHVMCVKGYKLVNKQCETIK